MGFGLIGAGAAVSGLMSGYQQGRKFAQDEERFEMEKEAAKQSKELRGLQIKRAQGELEDDDLERQIRADGDKIRREYEEKVKALQGQTAQVPAQAAGVVSPAPAGLAAPATFAEGDAAQPGISNPAAAQANAPQPGIADPAAQQAAPQTPQQAPRQAAPKTIFDLQREMHVALLNNQMRSKKADVPALMKQAFDSVRMYKMAETQATLDIMNSFEAGEPQDKLFARLGEMGKAPPPGTTMVRTTKPLFDGSTIMVPDVEIRMPDGTVLSKSKLSRNTATTEEIMRADTQIAQVAATVAHYKATEQHARDESARRDAADTRRHNEVMANLRQQAEQQSRMYQLNFDKFQWEQWDTRLRRATGEFERMYGFSPLTQSERLKLEKDGSPGDPKNGVPSDLEKAEARNAEASANVVAGMIVYDMNRDVRTLRPNANPAEIKQALDVVAKRNPALIKQDEYQRAYVDVGNNRVLIPKPGWLDAAKNKPEPAPAPSGRAEAAGAADPARPGISKPKPVGDLSFGAPPIERVSNRGGVMYRWNGKSYATEEEAKKARGY